MIARPFLAAAFAACAAASVTTAQFDPADRPASRGIARFAAPSPNFDARLHDADIRAAIEARQASPGRRARLEAAAQLGAEIRGATVELDPALGTPHFVRSMTTTLTGRTIGDPTALAVSRRFALERPELFGLTEAQIDRARVSREGVSRRSGMHVAWRQQLINGVEVYNAQLRGVTTRDGRLVMISSTMLPEPEGGFDPLAPAISRTEAVRLAAADMHIDLDPGELRPIDAEPDARLRQTFARTPALQLDAPTQFIYFPLNELEVRPAWKIYLSARGEADCFLYIIDAVTGGVLVRSNQTRYGGGGGDVMYSVYIDDSPAPFTPGPATPDGSQAPEIPRVEITIDAMDLIASPDGWMPSGTSETIGNNVDAHLDLNNDDAADLPRPAGVAFRDFRYALDLANAPATYRDATVSQLFYATNWFHDRLYGLGFTEEFANFQSDNFGRGGTGGDAVSADAQDGGSFNNANFLTFGDGTFSRVQMYLWSEPTPMRDGSLDNQIVIHELTHGLSTRMVGALESVQARGMGEGWSDFYALSLLSQPGEDPNAIYPLGGYATYLGTQGGAPLTDNYYFGIRRFPYTTDIAKSPLTFADIDPAQFGFDGSIPRNPVFGSATVTSVHNLGEVWCNTLWQARANLIAAHGDIGNEMMLEIVTEAFKLTPLDPHFLQARDAVLLADQVLNDGANQCALWAAFAKRGMGVNAFTAQATTTDGLVESFDAPVGLEFRYGPESATEPGATVAALTALDLTAHIDATCGDPLLTASPALRLSINGGPFQSIPLIETTPGEYDIPFPVLACGQIASWYLEGQTTSGLFTDPPNAPAQTFALIPFETELTVLDDTAEADNGWSTLTPGDDATTGRWERVDPFGTFAQPEDDHTAAPGSDCYITGQQPIGGQIGTNDVDGGVTTLTSPLIDCSAGEAIITYHRWYSNDRGASPNLDSMLVEVSNDDGANWTLVEDVSENANAWVKRSFLLSRFVAPTSLVRLRFIARDLGDGSIIEAGVDDVRVVAYPCAAVFAPADLDMDGDVDPEDLGLLLGAWGPCPGGGNPCPADLDGDGDVGPDDLALLLGAWG